MKEELSRECSAEENSYFTSSVLELSVSSTHQPPTPPPPSFTFNSCKWLSITLGVNALTAREMLSRFLESHRSKAADSESASLNATFCVAGETTDPATGNAQIHLRLTKESRVEAVKKSLSKVIGVYVYRFVVSITNPI